ncbi:beta,beta-carotene 15,15'-dioxygenase-like [Folsomia candida]|uniref:beta,beta-carotene 15,15'-dioxygenase-like n=1 Tax=Folsomia candida TaxID=158441 RepID=UPI0016050B2E|nr:beta,beta-carotene 15,15'-dioxygenase-like [Folsomia candida]
MATKDVKVKVFKSFRETRNPEFAQIIGEIPVWASGLLLRSCPAKWDYPKFRLNHAVDGYTMITKFEVVGGKSGSVGFSSKFLQSEAFKKAEVAQKPIIHEFSTRSAGSDSKSAICKVVSSVLPEVTDNCKYICNSDLCRNPTINADNGFLKLRNHTFPQNSTGQEPVKDLGLHGISSHPLTDPESGDTYNVGLHLVPTAKWKVIKFPTGCKSSLKETLKKGKIIASHPCRNKTLAPWVHSFGMSKNYVVWIDQPAHFNLTKAFKSVLKGFCPREVLEWCPEKKNQFCAFNMCTVYHQLNIYGKISSARFELWDFLNKKTLKVVKTEIISKDAFFFTHFLNCYEEAGHMVVDLFGMLNIQYCDGQALARLRSGKVMQDKDCPRLLRFVAPIGAFEDVRKFPENRNLVKMNSTGKAVRIGEKVILEPEIMSEIKMDLAVWNKKFYGENLRFIYATGALCPSVHHHKVVKFDLKTRKVITWEAELHQTVGEACFIPRPNCNEQDDGLIVLVVINYLELAEKQRDFVVWLNAKDFKEVGRAYFDVEIPIGLHSIFLAK